MSDFFMTDANGTILLSPEGLPLELPTIGELLNNAVAGHLDLPSGVQIRWGRMTSAVSVGSGNDNARSFTFSKPLSSGVLSSQLTLIGDGEYFTAKVTAESKTGITASCHNYTLTAKSYKVSYLVIGY